MAFTETHLIKNHLDTEIKINNYTVFRRDREERSHGGVVIHVWQDVAASVETLIAYSNSKAEMLALLIKELNQIVVIIYRPPDTSENESQAVTDKLENILKNT